MTKSELKTLLEAAALKQQSRAIALSGSDNPQVIASHSQSLTTYTALQAVLEALDAPRPAAAYGLQILAMSL